MPSDLPPSVEHLTDLGVKCRADFPLLAGNKDVVFLDSAASAQKPAVVLDRLRDFYSQSYANIHRGVYPLSIEATELYDRARETVAGFINADPGEIVFTRGATEGINLVAYAWGRRRLQQGDQIMVSLLEHHSNFVPWQMLAEATGAELCFIDVDENGCLNLADFSEKLSERVKLVAITQLSNAAGVRTPLPEVIKQAHHHGALVLVDAAQSATHLALDMKQLQADFLVFSGHKLYGPTGIGVLFARRRLLESMEPFHGGGDMIHSVSVDGTTYAEPPMKFEAGTPNIAGAIGLAAAIEYLGSFGLAAIAEHEDRLLAYLVEQLQLIEGLRLLGDKENRTALASFTVAGAQPFDIAQLLGTRNVAVRAGHHCAQPLMDRLGIPATLRASLAMYSTREDIDRFVEALGRVLKILRS